MIEILEIKGHSSTQLTLRICHTPASTNTHTLSSESARGFWHASGLLTPTRSTSYPFCFDSYREPYSALQGTAQGRATISLLVNKSVSYNPPSPPLCLDRPAQPRRGCFVREGGECQTTWAPLQSEAETERVVGLHSLNLEVTASTSDHTAW